MPKEKWIKVYEVPHRPENMRVAYEKNLASRGHRIALYDKNEFILERKWDILDGCVTFPGLRRATIEGHLMFILDVFEYGYREGFLKAREKNKNYEK